MTRHGLLIAALCAMALLIALLIRGLPGGLPVAPIVESPIASADRVTAEVEAQGFARPASIAPLVRSRRVR